MIETFAVGDQPRGCGKTRDIAGVYAEVGFSPFGSPLEDLLIDPIAFCDVEKWGISTRQPTLIENNGRVDVFDWIGEDSYPNKADFLEEVRRLGLSRRLELSENQYSQLTEDSRIFPIVPKAYIEPELLAEIKPHELHSMTNIGYTWDICPHNSHDPMALLSEPCASYLWRRTDIGTTQIEKFVGVTRYVERQMPAFTYSGVSSCDEFLDADPDLFKPGFVASFRIGRLAVVKDPYEASHREKLKKMRGCGIRVDEVDF